MPDRSGLNCFRRELIVLQCTSLCNNNFERNPMEIWKNCLEQTNNQTKNINNACYVYNV
jgi:hypothetical protein